MLNILNDKPAIEKLDSKGMLKSIDLLYAQINEVFEEVSKLKFKKYSSAKNIVFVGMGGSTLGAHCIKEVFKSEIAVPIEIVNHYQLPKSVGKDTLVLAVSYSGTTEETIAALKEAKKKTKKLAVVTSGGGLSEFARKNKIPALIFGTRNNPCGSPRMGLGYTYFGPLFLLSKLGFVDLSQKVIREIVSTVEKYQKMFSLDVPFNENIAKQLAEKVTQGTPWFVGAEHLSGNAHVAANQINENAKRFASFFVIPELNHHLLEGLSYPRKSDSVFIFIESDLYNERVIKRFEVTKDVLAKREIRFSSYKCREKTKLNQSAEVLVLGSFVSFYSAMLENIDPTAIPMVDFLKAALKDSKK